MTASQPNQGRGQEPTPSDAGGLCEYQCEDCRERCINPEGSEPSRANLCRECLSGDRDLAPETEGEDYANRPDPDEPWRYGCPECESFQLYERYEHEGVRMFRCEKCNSYAKQPDLVDRAAD